MILLRASHELPFHFFVVFLKTTGQVPNILHRITVSGTHSSQSAPRIGDERQTCCFRLRRFSGRDGMLREAVPNNLATIRRIQTRSKGRELFLFQPFASVRTFGAVLFCCFWLSVLFWYRFFLSSIYFIVNIFFVSVLFDKQKNERYTGK